MANTKNLATVPSTELSNAVNLLAEVNGEIVRLPYSLIDEKLVPLEEHMDNENNPHKLDVDDIGAATSEEVTQLKSDLTKETTERKTEIAVERERINQFTSLQEGSTTGDAELIDGRTDNKGKTWPNIGSHIRGITGQISTDLTDTSNLIAEQHLNIVYDYEIDDDTQSRQFIDFVPGNTKKNLYTDLEKKYFKLEAGKKYTILASFTVTGSIEGVVAIYLQTIAAGNIVDGSVRKLVYSDGIYTMSNVFTATTSNVCSLQILANNTAQTGRVVFDSIAILEGEVTLNEKDIVKSKNTRNYFSNIKFEFYEAKINELENTIIPQYEKVFDLIGDSLTGGAYGSGTVYKYENHLQELLPDWTMNNYGAGSEKANAISARSGGIQFYIMPCELSTNPTTVQFVDGQYRDFVLTTSTDFYNYYLSDGTKIIITRSTVDGVIVNYVSLESGTKSITRPMLVYNDFITSDRTKNVAIICIGSNGGINSEIDLVAQVKNIIRENKYTRYLVLPENMSDIGQKRDSLLRQNRYLNEEFGKHFVNTYDYMLRYGLSDFNITPTEEDEIDISLSVIPESLRCDAIHPNDKGCEIMANLIYLRGKELGYWT